MNNYLTIFLSIILCSSFCRANTVRFYDAEINEPVGGVTVIGNNGMIIGVSDAQGQMNVRSCDFPLHVTCMGYEPANVTSSIDTIMLSPATYSLSEVLIDSSGRPITRVVAYSRAYSTGATPSDTLQIFNEYMLEYFIANGKVKGYHKSDSEARIMAERSVARLAGQNAKDSIFEPRQEDEIKVLSFVEFLSKIPVEAVLETEAIRNGAISDTIMGKYYPKYIFRKIGDTYIVKRDMLSDHQGHTWCPWFFKMLGMTMHMNDITMTTGYQYNDNGKYDIQDLIYSTASFNVLAEGKLFKYIFKSKDSIILDSYYEQYPVSIEYLTIKEYDELRKEKGRSMDFEIPRSVSPLPAAVKRLTQR